MKMKPVQSRKQWNDYENDYICSLYMIMLDKQIQGIKYTKSSYVKQAVADLDRTKGSIECKLMNVSAIRTEQGLSTIQGYKPLSNYNKDLKIAYNSLFNTHNKCISDSEERTEEVSSQG